MISQKTEFIYLLFFVLSVGVFVSEEGIQRMYDLGQTARVTTLILFEIGKKNADRGDYGLSLFIQHGIFTQKKTYKYTHSQRHMNDVKLGI